LVTNWYEKQQAVLKELCQYMQINSITKLPPSFSNNLNLNDTKEIKVPKQQGKDIWK